MKEKLKNATFSIPVELLDDLKNIVKTGRQGENIYPTEVFLLKNDTGLEKDSIAMAHQIRVISKERLLEQCGSIDSDDIKENIKNAVKVYLDL